MSKVINSKPVSRKIRAMVLSPKRRMAHDTSVFSDGVAIFLMASPKRGSFVVVTVLKNPNDDN
jgi:hypothetical protein